jgi:hypothetical protein
VPAPRVSSAERRKITIEYNNAFTGTYPTRIEWLNSAGGLVRTLNPPTAESISATSVGNLLAPIEGSFTLKRSGHRTRDRQSTSVRSNMAGPVHRHP